MNSEKKIRKGESLNRSTKKEILKLKQQLETAYDIEKIKLTEDKIKVAEDEVRVLQDKTEQVKKECKNQQVAFAELNKEEDVDHRLKYLEGQI